MEPYCIKSFFDEIEQIRNSDDFLDEVKEIVWWSKEAADKDEGIISMRDVEDEIFDEVFSTKETDCSVPLMQDDSSDEEGLNDEFSEELPIDYSDFFEERFEEFLMLEVREYRKVLTLLGPWNLRQILEVESRIHEDDLEEEEEEFGNEAGGSTVTVVLERTELEDVVWGLRLFENIISEDVPDIIFREDAPLGAVRKQLPEKKRKDSSSSDGNKGKVWSSDSDDDDDNAPNDENEPPGFVMGHNGMRDSKRRSKKNGTVVNKWSLREVTNDFLNMRVSTSDWKDEENQVRIFGSKPKHPNLLFMFKFDQWKASNEVMQKEAAMDHDSERYRTSDEDSGAENSE